MRATPLSVAALGLCLLVAGAHANENVVLTVKPVLCIVGTSKPSCEMRFLVAWHSEVAGDFCLFSDFAPSPIDCWAAQSSGTIEEIRVVIAPFSYWISDGDAERRLAEKLVDVMSTDLGDRRRNRRNRHAWSVL